MKYGILFSLTIFLFACTVSKKATVNPPNGQLVLDGKLWSSLFQQRAAEYRALCLQAYNIARLRLDEELKNSPGKPRAVITDIDETFLDNSPYAVHQALKGKDYEQASWYEWTGRADADTLAGALSFFNYAASRNVEVFYITNRDGNEKAATLANLQRFHFPFADDQHLLVKTTTSGKEERRLAVAHTREIILLLGDNLSDFSALFDKKSETERDQAVLQFAAEFGNRFIILPNANYGGWEDAVYDNSHGWSPAQKDSLIKSKLKTY